MRKEIFYFTATGNSLVIANTLAEKLEGKVTPISSMNYKDSITLEADIIGIIFPVYYATNGCNGMPQIVENFIHKLENIDLKYIFAICTHNGMPGTTIENLANLIRSKGGKLAGGFTIKTYNNAPSVSEKLKRNIFQKELKTNMRLEIRRKQQIYDESTKKKLVYIHDYILSKRIGILETRSKFKKLIMFPFLNLLIKPVFNHRYKKLSQTTKCNFEEMIPLADKSFRTDNKCNGCGICVQICSVNNINIIKNRPVWQHHCMNCLACFVWCPNEAIYGEIAAYSERYHHPEVKISELINNNGNSKIQKKVVKCEVKN